MTLSLRKLVGTRLLLLVAGLLASFLALASSLQASAVTINGNATWIDKNTIRYNGVDFKGPVAMKLNIDLDGNQGDFQVFKISSGSSILFFRSDVNMDTATKVSVNDNTSAIDAAQTNLTNLRSAVPAGTPPGTTTPTSGSTGEVTPVCDVGALSFIFCPVIDTMAKAVGIVGSVIDGMMVVNPLPLGDSNNTIFKAWSGMLNLANVLLAIAFLFVIFAQATSLALSNYGVKRMLPRIIAAAILMNLSYYICAFAIDISNLAGSGITGLLLNIDTLSFGSGLPKPISADTGEGIGAVLGNLVGGIVSVTFTIGILVLLVAFALTPTLLAVLAVLFTLAARHAIIVLLVMVAPLAFVAWVLPNTERWFKKWWEWFFQMLILYPMVMAAFAAAVVAANVVATGAAKPTNSEFNGLATGAFQGIIALIIISLPLLALPALFKASGSAMNRLQGLATGNMQKYGGNAMHNAATDIRKRKMNEYGARMAANGLGKDADGNPIAGRRARVSRGIGASAAFVGGYKARRDFKIASQKSNVERLQQHTVADKVLEDEAFAARAAGVGGAEGIQRAQSSAVATVLKHEQEEAANRVQLLGYGARQSGMQVKEYVRAVMGAGPVGSEMEINGHRTRIDNNLLSAVADYSATNGEIPFLEQLRQRADVDQDALDEVIRRNDGAIKGKGGFHLANDLSLAYGRQSRDASRAAMPLQQRMDIARMEMLSGSSAMDVGSMKFGEFGNIHASVITTPRDATGRQTGPAFIDAAKIQQNFGQVPEGARETIAATLADVLNNQQARANAGDRLELVVQTAQALNQAGGVQIEISPEDIRRFGLPRPIPGGDSGDAGDD